MTAGVDMKQVRHDILNELAEKRTQSTADSERVGATMRGPELLHLIRQDGFANQAFDDIISTEINLESIKPGTIWDDIQEYIQENELSEKWAISENVDDADDIMDDDDAQAEKNKHIRITIQPDGIDGGEERDVVKGFDSETIVEIKFYQNGDSSARVHIQATKGDHAAWKQFFVNEDNGLKKQWIGNGTLIQHQTQELAVE